MNILYEKIEDKKITNMWDKIQYFDRQPIIWIYAKIHYFPCLKFFKNAWGIEKQHKKVEIVWWKMEYFHSQLIISCTHFKTFFKIYEILSFFFMFYQKFAKINKNPLLNTMIFNVFGCQNIHSRAENVQNHVYRKNTWCRAERWKRRFF